MDTTGIRAVIEEPARVAGLTIEPGLVDVIVRDVTGERTGRERAPVHHGQLARRREDCRDEHEDEDREQAVVADEGRHALDSNGGS